MHINTGNEYFKNKFGCKTYKLSLNAGMTCPNRDGKIDTRGCIFCSAGGSGDFAASPKLSITEQIAEAKALIASKVPKDCKYIAYFQAYTNTYAPVSYLRKVFFEAISNEDIVGISIATRPDCLEDDVIELLDELNKIKPVFIELGLQTANEDTATFIRRGYKNEIFEVAVKKLSHINIEVIIHMIIGLPNETEIDILNTVDYINKFPVKGVKFQLLHILTGTDLLDYYKNNKFRIFSLEEYTHILLECILRLRSDIVIHRMTGDGPKKLLVEPKWSCNKKYVLNYINTALKEKNINQGEKSCHSNH
ncbi:MAG: TIGR01212 family radical SAM protein [Lachnospiraceae bacterium]|nr:TIGR01212 family radical SAM protein [Lachnospiraceae bacterium]